MRLIEADGKELLRRRGLPVPRGRLHRSADGIAPPAGPVAVKAQMLAGGRGKAGLVQLAAPELAGAVAVDILSRMEATGHTPGVLIEEQVAYETEWYLAWRIDDVRQCPVLMFSLRGGVEIESNAASLREFAWDVLRPLHPHHALRFLADCGVTGRALGPTARLAAELYRVLIAEDAELVEINPLAVLATGQVMALDAKVTLDDNARFRHREWRELLSHGIERAALTPLERQATENNFTFVELDGSVALFAGGAGFGMAIVDLLADAGLPPANFADATGGSGAKEFAAVADVVLGRAAQPDVKAVVFFQTMSATSLKFAVDGLIDAIDRTGFAKPLVVGFAASAVAQREMTAHAALALFPVRGYHAIGDLDELVPTLRKLVGYSGWMPIDGITLPQ
jgi:succinyl-CoA synthetase beta subunit